MGRLFLAVFDMGMSAGYLILAVIVARFLLKKAPKDIICILWMVVGLRLICPFQVETAFSLLPEKTDVILFQENPIPDSGKELLVSDMPLYHRNAVGDVQAPDNGKAAAKISDGISQIVNAAAFIWLAGMCLLCMYLAYSWLRIKKSVAAAVPASSDGIRFYRCERIASPFLFGIAKPKIYVPFCVSGRELSYVLKHERAHQSHLDYLAKFIGYLLLAVYWFQPLAWAAYLLFCRDMELACDERVVKEIGESCKKAYSQALLACSVNRGNAAACPVAFGEIGVKNRVKNILNYKKPKFEVILAAVLVCLAVTACFATEAKSKPKTRTPLAELPKNYSLEQAKTDGCVVHENGDISNGQQVWEAFAASAFAGEPASVRLGFYYTVEGSGYGKEYYASIQEDYPAFYIEDLEFDGSSYTLTSYEDGYEGASVDGKICRNYRYMKRFEGKAETADATYGSYVRYVLTDDADATWEQLWRGLISSKMEDHTGFTEVYVDYIGRPTPQADAGEEGNSDIEDSGKEILNKDGSEKGILNKDGSEKGTLSTEDSEKKMIDKETKDKEALNKDDSEKGILNEHKQIPNPKENRNIKKWAKAFCDRDAKAVSGMLDKATRQEMLDGEHSFGWSSPWPWGTAAKEQPNYQIVFADEGKAVILYYAWTSDPHVTVWNQTVTYQHVDDKEGAFQINSVATQVLDSIHTAGKFYLAYPDGVIDGTKMDYYRNGAGEALHNNAQAQGLPLYQPDTAAVYLLNLQNDPSVVKTDVIEQDGETVVTFTFLEDGTAARVKMIQPYGADGIWVPQTCADA